MTPIVPASYEATGKVCLHCGVLAQHHIYSWNHEYVMARIKSLKCTNCGKPTIWFDSKVIFPTATSAPPACADMPQSVRDLYDEAASVVNASPRAAAALLRVATELLIKELTGGSGSLNDQIGNLVAKGLSIEIQKALDVLRIVGNNAVHSGQINLDDNEKVANSLFGLLNVVVEKMITFPAHIEKLWDGLPQGNKDQVKQRDNSNKE